MELFRIRPATPTDVSAITRLISLSARGLCVGDYTPVQVEAALGSAWGCDTELIRDGTYFVIDGDDGLAAAGGWGKRRTLFGGDAQPDRRSELLDPAWDAARIRAFFVHPAWAGRGLARRLLDRCEAEARAYGFRSAELMATLTGVGFYQRHGYVDGERVENLLPNGLSLPFVPMRRSLVEPRDDRPGVSGRGKE